MRHQRADRPLPAPIRPLLGAHVSIQGGPSTAFDRAEEAGCDTAQIFTKNTGTWKAAPLAAAEVEAFRARARDSPVKPVLAHAAYLPNLASPGEDLRRKSIEAVRLELERCEALGIPHLVLHPGAHMGAGEKVGLRRLVASLNTIHAASKGCRSGILLETTAGQGTAIGCSFAFLGAALARVKAPERLGICFDSCHLFAAGYDLRNDAGYERAMEELEREVGLEKLHSIHLNDSKKDLGSRVDRHEHIGKGFLGLGAFRRILNDPRFQEIPMVLETPKENDMDRKNLAALRRLIGKSLPLLLFLLLVLSALRLPAEEPAALYAERTLVYTEFPETGHDSWTPGYQHPDFLAWLFGQKRDAVRF